MKKIAYFIAMAIGGVVPFAAQATEGGGSTYASGSDNFLVGAVPPSGLHVLIYGDSFSADTMKDNAGNNKPISDFSLHLNLISTRIIWSSPYKMLGGNLVLHSVLPLVDLRAKAAGDSVHKTGLADITFGPAIAFHYSEKLHSVVGIDFVAPTGSYHKEDVANIGRNYWSAQPTFAMSYVDPKGFNGDFKATVNINSKNDATDYRSGDEFWLDYSAGWGISHGLTVGVAGYLTEQLTADEQYGETVSDSRARGFAAGPSLKYDNGHGWVITAKYQHDMESRNRVQGNAFWIKSAIPF